MIKFLTVPAMITLLLVGQLSRRRARHGSIKLRAGT